MKVTYQNHQRSSTSDIIRASADFGEIDKTENVDGGKG